MAAAAITVLTVGSLTVEVVGAVRTTATLTRPALKAELRANEAKLTCLRDELHRQIPEGTRVDIPPTTTANGLLLLRIVTPWALPVSGSRAEWAVSLVDGSCAGQGVAVRQRGDRR